MISSLTDFGSTFTFYLLSVVFIVVYASLFYFFALRVIRRRRDYDSKLKEALITGLVNGQIEGVDDLVNLYRGVTNSSDDDVSYKAAVSRILRRVLVSLASDPDQTAANLSLRNKVKLLLNRIEAETPFAELPTAERNLIIDARKYIGANELGAATQKVNDLANLIEARQDAYEKLQAANKWSVPLAIIGLVLTVVFGVISLLPILFPAPAREQELAQQVAPGQNPASARPPISAIPSIANGPLDGVAVYVDVPRVNGKLQRLSAIDMCVNGVVYMRTGRANELVSAAKNPSHPMRCAIAAPSEAAPQ